MSDDGYVDASRLTFEVKRYCRSRLANFADVAFAIERYYSVERLQGRRLASLEREKTRIVRHENSTSIRLMRQPNWSERRDWPTSDDTLQLLHDRFMAVVEEAINFAWFGRYRSTIESVQAKLIVYVFWLLVDDSAHRRAPLLCSIQGLPWRTDSGNGRSDVDWTWLGPGISSDADHARRMKNLRLDLVARAFDELRMNEQVPGGAEFELLSPRECAIDVEDRESGTARIGSGFDDGWLGEFTQIAEAAHASVAARQPPPASDTNEQEGDAKDGLGVCFEPKVGRRGEVTGLRVQWRLRPDSQQQSALLSGRTIAVLAEAVIGQPDQDHSWASLVRSLVQAGKCRSTTPDSMRRAGARVRAALPPELRSYWVQGQMSVRWHQPNVRG